MKDIFQYPRSMYGKIFKRESYNVGIIYAPIHSVLSSECQPEIQWLPRRSRSGTFVADPFGIEHNGRQYLLCEYFDYREPKARIMGAEINCPLFSADLKDAIVAPCHISYPFLFRHEGQVYCIPETSRANEVALYKAEKLPYTWTKEMVLLFAQLCTSAVAGGFFTVTEISGVPIFVSHMRIRCMALGFHTQRNLQRRIYHRRGLVERLLSTRENSIVLLRIVPRLMEDES